MVDELSSDLMKGALALSDEKRAKYFFDAVQKSQKIWILTDEHGCVMLNTEDEDCVPVWPDEEFAQAWATDEWSNCKAEAISLQKWLSRWSQGLDQDELALVVFPSQDEQGLVYYPDEFEHELLRKKSAHRSG